MTKNILQLWCHWVKWVKYTWFYIACLMQISLKIATGEKNELVLFRFLSDRNFYELTNWQYVTWFSLYTDFKFLWFPCFLSSRGNICEKLKINKILLDISCKTLASVFIVFKFYFLFLNKSKKINSRTLLISVWLIQIKWIISLWWRCVLNILFFSSFWTIWGNSCHNKELHLQCNRKG